MEFPDPNFSVPASHPVFIGHTAKTANDKLDFRSAPIVIRSFVDFEHFFGNPFDEGYLEVTLGAGLQVKEIALKYHLGMAVKTFLEKGGEKCTIISVGSFQEEEADPVTAYEKALEVAGFVADANLLVLPDLVRLSGDHRTSVISSAVSHCAKTGTRMVLLDGPGTGPGVFSELDGVPPGERAYAAVFGPWIQAEWMQRPALTDFEFVSESGERLVFPDILKWVSEEEGSRIREILTQIESLETNEALAEGIMGQLEEFTAEAFPPVTAVLQKLSNEGIMVSPVGLVTAAIIRSDRQHGVWKTPANSPLDSSMVPAFEPDTEMHLRQLNRDPSVPVNFIGTAPSGGLRIKTALTATSEPRDARLMHLQRLRIMICDQARYLIGQFAGRPNSVEAWQAIANAMAQFLFGLYQKGVLKGEKTEEAFGIRIGEATTMSGEEIAAGIMRMHIFVAPDRGGEFMDIWAAGNLLPPQPREQTAPG